MTLPKPQSAATQAGLYLKGLLTGLAVLALIALAVLSLAGCGAIGQSSSPANYHGSGAAVVDTPSGAATTARGTLPKEVGQEAGMTNMDGSTLLLFTIDRVSAVTKCEGGAFGKKAQGKYIELELTIHTKNDPNNMLPLMSFSTGWEHVTAQGVTTEASTFDAAVCGSDYKELGPNRTYQQTVVLDVPKDSKGGVITFRPAGNPGWEWKLDT